ncbi:hypothetical protein LWP59_39240 [Amycolatopsis acidiphila]|uniref:Uncharacterized protein n=1 Tax=Amycolatopsis acidiphila TaxID=715473 RepID=A0A558AGT8_9PSEU|nr:hypothetical protein [Amycolatopsis acidiphila]TVT23490.1 hypothetical protein FNH06_09870 [Amycolatopsis acidiphila]UIJ59949.1 hypothetical protein LWP59_39240 [Amycolatopsis acidiphila]
MSELQDPERLLAEALRAQARSAPPGAGRASEPPATSLPPQYGLLSGADGNALERERAALEPPTVRHPAVKADGPVLSLPAHWILLLAVLLGLATGAVIGLITLL